MNVRVRHRETLSVLIPAICIGCLAPNAEKAAPIAPPPPKPAVVKPKKTASPPAKKLVRVTKRKGNEHGLVLIPEYHHIRAGRGPMFRSVSQFREDLERMYADGFRPVTLNEYLANKMHLAPGASPVIITFDDANPTQIRLLKDGTVDPECAVGIWMEFAKKHPDFPVHGTFFVLPTMWWQKQFVKEKVKLLTNLGSEIDSHTVTHPVMSRESDERLKWEVGLASLKLEHLGLKPPFNLAYPFGVPPRHKGFMKGFIFRGEHVWVKSGILAFGEPALSPTSPHLQRFGIKRIVACDDYGGLDTWLRRAERHTIKVYVQP
jgi:hypothetical protein